MMPKRFDNPEVGVILNRSGKLRVSSWGTAMRFSVRKLFVVILSMLLVPPEWCVACLWDSETLAMERQRFPAAHELIAGYFIRHSRAYYEWRISDRGAKPVDQRTALDYDDLAVAYDKLLMHDKAIETIEAKIERWPNEYRYESEANLGTFLIHAERYEAGLQHIKRAIEINRDAHFGREVYQKLLVEYVIQQRKKHSGLPLDENFEAFQSGPFADFVLAARPAAVGDRKEIEKAAKGIMGMMRFGHHDSPVLLEALGDLLLFDLNDSNSDAKRLAARAYLKASQEVDDPKSAQAYRKKAEYAIMMQLGVELDDIESDLKDETEQAAEFFAAISRDEEAWIAAGKDVDREFTKKYYQDPKVAVGSGPTRGSMTAQMGFWLVGGIAALFVVCLLVAFRRARRGRLVAADSESDQI